MATVQGSRHQIIADEVRRFTVADFSYIELRILASMMLGHEDETVRMFAQGVLKYTDRPTSDELVISVREANELRFLTSKEFYPQRFEAFHEMLRRIDKELTERGVEPIKSKLDV